jgi:hypothetical protein
MATGALALASLSMLSAKSYGIILDSPTKAGTVQLTAGKYNVKLQGANAVFTNEDNGSKFTAPVKLVNENKKFADTAVEISTVNGAKQVTGIELGGSRTLLEFGD